MPDPPDVPRLTRCEMKVLNLCAQGFDQMEIAQMLCNSFRTVNFHTTNIRGKFEVDTVGKAIYRAYQFGIIEPPKRIA